MRQPYIDMNRFRAQCLGQSWKKWSNNGYNDCQASPVGAILGSCQWDPRSNWQTDIPCCTYSGLPVLGRSHNPPNMKLSNVLALAITFHGTKAHDPTTEAKITPRLMLKNFGNKVVRSFAKMRQLDETLVLIWQISQIVEQRKTRNRPPALVPQSSINVIGSQIYLPRRFFEAPAQTMLKMKVKVLKNGTIGNCHH
ncbi:hypothetical protein P152DRAFT_503342 [Eremomyces bilateralis CBS 781.70]|uniref:Uncharacterized protein n=1 Tax=Eremomyces bilateralis CBS 781.70 TaxID=1392243 RepID=A0A6G1G4E0_9PEZI|nr:uncharacterized protein P152DRAFT_503342 [Eremomyces bilateralis CBS 781.70]KAF1812811.1 hypothetical protein P152DRAFT_503342 [Eremomyces bilateralis CBS 781.70]